jgi:hypothetical protein
VLNHIEIDFHYQWIKQGQAATPRRAAQKIRPWAEKIRRGAALRTSLGYELKKSCGDIS